MEPNKSQHNSQTALFAIAIILALGVGFYMGYQTGFVNGGADMHEHMDGSMGAIEDHMHTMMHDHTGTDADAMGGSVKDAMMQMDAAAQ